MSHRTSRGKSKAKVPTECPHTCKASCVGSMFSDQYNAKKHYTNFGMHPACTSACDGYQHVKAEKEAADIRDAEEASKRAAEEQRRQQQLQQSVPPRIHRSGFFVSTASVSSAILDDQGDASDIVHSDVKVPEDLEGGESEAQAQLQLNKTLDDYSSPLVCPHYPHCYRTHPDFKTISEYQQHLYLRSFDKYHDCEYPQCPAYNLQQADIVKVYETLFRAHFADEQQRALQQVDLDNDPKVTPAIVELFKTLLERFEKRKQHDSILNPPRLSRKRRYQSKTELKSVNELTAEDIENMEAGQFDNGIFENDPNSIIIKIKSKI